MATTIQHSGHSVYAVLSSSGPAIYPSLNDAIEAVRSDAVLVSEGDRKYYAERAWHNIDAADLPAEFADWAARELA
jgi:hypothetical protein